MSLIYKSLEQLKRKQGSGEVSSPGSLNGAVSRSKDSGKKRSLVLPLLITLFVVAGVSIASVTYLYAPSLLEEFTGSDEPVAAGPLRSRPVSKDTASAPAAPVTQQSSATAMAGDKGTDNQAVPVMDTEGVAPADAEEKPDHGTIIDAPAVDVVASAGNEEASADAQQKESGFPEKLPLDGGPLADLDREVFASSKAESNALQHSGSKEMDELEVHFSDQARRNRKVSGIEASLLLAVNSADYQDASRLVQMLEDILGEESLSVLKWRGFLALSTGAFEQAEEYYTLVLAGVEHDFDSSYNLIVAMIAQGKEQQAKEVYEGLRMSYPHEDRLVTLARMLQKTR